MSCAKAGRGGINLHKNWFISVFMIFSFRFDDGTFVKCVQQFQNLQFFSPLIKGLVFSFINHLDCHCKSICIRPKSF